MSPKLLRAFTTLLRMRLLLSINSPRGKNWMVIRDLSLAHSIVILLKVNGVYVSYPCLFMVELPEITFHNSRISYHNIKPLHYIFHH